MIGLAAKTLLAVGRTSDELDTLEHELIESAREALLKSITISKKNSSEESGSVSPMTTARADVSTTKQQEGLDFANPSLPRKRGRPRKEEVSSLQKRKIGTKREKPAS